jgi:hypothetical protein
LFLVEKEKTPLPSSNVKTATKISSFGKSPVSSDFEISFSDLPTFAVPTSTSLGSQLSQIRTTATHGTQPTQGIYVLLFIVIYPWAFFVIYIHTGLSGMYEPGEGLPRPMFTPLRGGRAAPKKSWS